MCFFYLGENCCELQSNLDIYLDFKVCKTFKLPHDVCAHVGWLALCLVEFFFGSVVKEQ